MVFSMILAPLKIRQAFLRSGPAFSVRLNLNFYELLLLSPSSVTEVQRAREGLVMRIG